MCKLLIEWRNCRDRAWLADAPVPPLQQTLKDLERAYAKFFAKRAGCPRFKKKGQSDSFRYPDPKQIKLDQANTRLFLPKLGWLRYRHSRDVLGTVKNVTVSQSCGKWFVSIQTERELAPPVSQGGAVGIDMGMVRFATLSDGTFYAPLHSFKRHEAMRRKAQQAMSRKTQFSNNCEEGESPRPAHSRPHRQCPPRLPAQSHEPYAHGFHVELVEQGYTPVSATWQVRLMTHLSRWMAE